MSSVIWRPTSKRKRSSAANSSGQSQETAVLRSKCSTNKRRKSCEVGDCSGFVWESSSKEGIMLSAEKNEKRCSESTVIYCWGSASSSQLGPGKEIEYLKPKKLTFKTAAAGGAGQEGGGQEKENVLNGVVSVSCGLNHVALLTSKGIVLTLGSNTHGQLGRSGTEKLPLEVSLLSETHTIKVISAGCEHTGAITAGGEVYIWGSNEYGQCGFGPREGGQRPRRVQGVLSGIRIVSLACGKNFTIVASETGSVYGWGEGEFGQLGCGKGKARWDLPREFIQLSGVPVCKVACGDFHCLALTTSGTTLAWGDNRFGQLGRPLNHIIGVPSPVAAVVNEVVIDIACGGEFSCLLTRHGRVYVFGRGSSGQLGTGGTARCFENPRMVPDLMGIEVVSLSAGKTHMMVYVEESGQIFCWGSGSCGQLGSGVKGDSSVPVKVNIDDNVRVTDMGCGLNFSYVLCSREKERERFDFVNHMNHNMSETLHISSFELRKLINACKSANDNASLCSYINKIFQNPCCINASFLEFGNTEKPGFGKNNFMKYEDVVSLFDQLKDLPETHESLHTALNSLWFSFLKNQKVLYEETMSVLIFLLASPICSKPMSPYYRIVTMEIAEFICGSQVASECLSNCWKTCPLSWFQKTVNTFQRFLTILIATREAGGIMDSNLYSVCSILDMMYKLNESRKVKLCNHLFYCTDLCAKLNFQKEYQIFRLNNSFSICKYPFLLTPEFKYMLMKIDAYVEMEGSQSYNLILQLLLGKSPTFLKLVVRRPHLVNDCLAQVSSKSPRELKRPLRVVFKGEEGVDEGGVMKEFFFLVLRTLFDARYGMFKQSEGSSKYWFNAHSLEHESQFWLAGVIVGLAVYNGIVIEKYFPHAFYKILFDQEPNLNDLKEIDPPLWKNLNALLEYDDTDFEEAFGINFVIQEDKYGEIKSIELCANGEEVPVTKKNRERYASAYVKHLLVTSVATQTAAFIEGFKSVCTAFTFYILTPSELELVITGTSDIDINDLKSKAKYLNGFEETDTTCDESIPISGLTISLQKASDISRLPVAHTCFNLLDLPAYDSLDTLTSKFHQALENTEGFHLI
eukprot:Nk52_evm43s2192 gene=Nk52_evmTU43s2192